VFSFFKNKANPESFAQTVNLAAQDSKYDDAIKRELVKGVLKDALRLSGIPPHWVTCELLNISNAPERFVHIQLTMNVWSEELLKYSVALQRKILIGLEHYEPGVDHSRHVFSWQISPHSQCPHLEMPDPDAWHRKTPDKSTEGTLNLFDRRKRPRGLTQNPSPHHDSDIDPPDDGFASTTVAPL
jgi:hypothetical protein